MKILLALLLAIMHWSVSSTAHAAAAAQKEAESKGFRFEGNRDAIIAKAQKEGGLRALLGFDKPAVIALRTDPEALTPRVTLSSLRDA